MDDDGALDPPDPEARRHAADSRLDESQRSPLRGARGGLDLASDSGHRARGILAKSEDQSPVERSQVGQAPRAGRKARGGVVTFDRAGAERSGDLLRALLGL